jgi:hypothetical protein
LGDDYKEEETEDCDTGSTASTVSNNESDKDASLEDQFNNQVSRLILKSVFGTIPNREQIVKLLKLRFNVHQKLLTSLTPTQLNEVMAKKLIKNNYITINKGVSLTKLKNGDFHVVKEIAL